MPSTEYDEVNCRVYVYQLVAETDLRTGHAVRHSRDRVRNSSVDILYSSCQIKHGIVLYTRRQSGHYIEV
jgi:hypothetical protein